MHKYIEYKDITKFLKKEEYFSPIYILLGNELLLVNECKFNIISEFKKQGFIYFYNSSMDSHSDWSEFMENIKSISLFEKYRIFNIDITNASPGKIGSEYIIKIANFLAEQKDTILIIQVPKKDINTKNSSWMKSLTKLGITINIPNIKSNELPFWIKERLLLQKQYIDNSSLFWIANQVDNNLVLANQEITKLGLIFGEGYINEESIKNSIVSNNSKYNIYDFRLSIFQKKIPKILEIILYLQEENIHPALILWAIYEDIRIIGLLIEAPKEQIHNIFNNNKIFGNHRNLIENYSLHINKNFLYTIINKLHNIDLRIKGIDEAGNSKNLWAELINIAINIATYKIS
ncbi:MAG: DNA polymerase III subunit delta [Candidatus Kinetoplastibacterium crithidii]|nr:MAG: DNA polymerase III subunit delta [Candidatus Kinetoplastibacterium crithidii]